MKTLYCKYCGKAFESDGSFRMAGIATAHMRTCLLNPKRAANIAAQKRGSMAMHRKVEQKERTKKVAIAATRKKRQFVCANPACKKIFYLELTDVEYEKIIAKKQKKFCSKSCAAGKGCPHHIRNSKNITLYRRASPICRIPIHIHGKTRQKTYRFKQCPICKKWFLDVERKQYCSDKCKIQHMPYILPSTREKLSLAGRKSAAKQFMQKRSKCEMEFCQLCEKHFSIVEHNKAIFNGWDADVLLPELKVAIQWNGPWHYKQISKKKSASLAAIQNRDRIKRQEIEKAGWSLYIVKDQDSHKNVQIRAAFVEKHFQRFVEFLEQHQNIQFYEEFELI